jgi:hypothetical protein
MQNPRANPRKGTKFPEVKLLIATVSLAVVIGVWNLLSNQAVEAEKAPPAPVEAPPLAGSTADLSGQPPIPTLVPLVDLSSLIQASAAGQPVPVVSSLPSNKPAAALRSVTIPTQTTIIQKNKPVIEQQVQVIVSGGGGGGGGGSSPSVGSGGGGGGSAPAPVTTTHSSHP